MILKFYWNTLKTKWTPKNKRQKEHLLVTLGDERNAPGDSWRQKKCLLEALEDEKNASQRLLETKGTPPGDEMDSWKQLINFNNRKNLFISKN
ncbi:unnamed protein product [Rhizophagus irregularis]|nr:unnamed protein product [Rhizophagus irregularis]